MGLPLTKEVISNDDKGSLFSISRSPSGMSSDLAMHLSLIQPLPGQIGVIQLGQIRHDG